jgi:hypothetical protein
MIALFARTNFDPNYVLASIFPFLHGKFADLAGIVLALLAIGAAGKLAMYFGQRYSGGAAFHNPRKLFVTLCRAHNLDRSQQRLLVLLAQHHRLPQPPTLFLQPALFEAASLGPQLSSQASQLRAMQQQLFKQ